MHFLHAGTLNLFISCYPYVVFLLPTHAASAAVYGRIEKAHETEINYYIFAFGLIAKLLPKA
jgi:hypothetical protein